MTDPSMDVEHTARAFPSPKHSRPARSLTYKCGGHIYEAVIGQQRTRFDNAIGWLGRRKLGGQAALQPSGTTVLSIVATATAVEIWSREPSRDWPNPSLVARDAVLNIDYLDDQNAIAN
jgi:hypothetical protein